MRWTLGAVWTAVLGLVSAADTTTYKDPTTGFTFSQYNAAYQYNSPAVIAIKTAVSSTASSPYDIVVQLTCPSDVGWVGVAWAGTMINNPLSVAWKSGSNVVVSNRWASAHAQPSAYTGETLTVLKKGTSVTGSSWQVTFKCSGCTTWTSSGRSTSLSPTGVNRLAYAYSATAPSSPSSNTSTFGVHDLFAYWNHDFSQGTNTNFDTLVTQNA